MTRILLAAVNAKYIHSNLGIYSLKAYAQEYAKARLAERETECGIECETKCGIECEAGQKMHECSAFPEILIGEYTINQQTEQILRDIYEKKPDMVGFSCYIARPETPLFIQRRCAGILGPRL